MFPHHYAYISEAKNDGFILVVDKDGKNDGLICVEGNDWCIASSLNIKKVDEILRLRKEANKLEDSIRKQTEELTNRYRNKKFYMGCAPGCPCLRHPENQKRN